MNSKNPRHNSVRIVRRDYCYSGTCQSQCSALEDILLSINAETTYHSSKRNVFFVERKRQNKNKTKKKTQRPLEKLSSLYCEILLRWRLACRITDNFAEMFKTLNPRYFILMKCFPICVLRVMKIPSDDDFNNYFQFYSSLWCLIRVSIAVPRVKLQWQP